jgi:hypothetical protein
VEETTIAGIIPIDDEQVSVDLATFDLDFNNQSGITVDEQIERSASLKMTYDLTYSGSNASVRFFLPLLNKLDYLDQGVQIFADGVEIEPTLNISPKHTSYPHDSYTRMVEQDFVADYRENMLQDYDFVHDVDGYRYTVKNPKTREEKFLVDTYLRFINVPVDTVFMDANNYDEEGSSAECFWGSFKAEQEFVFFSSSDLPIEAESKEVERYKAVLIDRGVILDDPQITKTEMKLSEYLNNQTFKARKFLDTQKKFFLLQC